MTKVRRRWIKRVLIGVSAAVAVGVAALAIVGYRIMWMPGWSYSGALPAMTPQQVALRERLKKHIEVLATELGERNADHIEAYERGEQYIAGQLREAGYEPEFVQPTLIAGKRIANVVAELPGKSSPGEIIVVGAHFDTVPGAPGANDNGSGVAAMLEMARSCASKKFDRTLRFVAFYNEEQVLPGGSAQYAAACRAAGDNIAGMICLETIGYYTDEPDSQKYPFPFSVFYPSTGNFVGFVGNLDSRPLVRQCAASFRAHEQFPSRGAALPAMFKDAARSDHSAFWAQGYEGLMVTDTANFRYPYYHDPRDTADKIDYDRFARVTEGLVHVVDDVAGAQP